MSVGPVLEKRPVLIDANLLRSPHKRRHQTVPRGSRRRWKAGRREERSAWTKMERVHEDLLGHQAEGHTNSFLLLLVRHLLLLAWHLFLVASCY